MSRLAEMWEALSAYQPRADAEGHGKSWALMCSEKTREAADVAAYEAIRTDHNAAIAATAAANDAYHALSFTPDLNLYTQRAIDRINKAQRKPK